MIISVNRKTERSYASDVNLVFNEINRLRLRCNFPMLSQNSYLATASQNKSSALVQTGSFAHNLPDGTTPYQTVSATGYVAGGNIFVGEVLAMSGDLVDAPLLWLNSQAHAELIFSLKANEIGLGTSTFQMTSSNQNFSMVNVVGELGRSPGYTVPADAVAQTRNCITALKNSPNYASNDQVIFATTAPTPPPAITPPTPVLPQTNPTPEPLPPSTTSQKTPVASSTPVTPSNSPPDSSQSVTVEVTEVSNNAETEDSKVAEIAVTPTVVGNTNESSSDNNYLLRVMLGSLMIYGGSATSFFSIWFMIKNNLAVRFNKLRT